MTILVLGGTGMLGSALVEQLIRTRPQTQVYIHGSHNCDLTNKKDTIDYISSIAPKTIFNCAGSVGGILKNQNNQYNQILVNTSIAFNALEAAISCNVNDYFYISSSCVYPANSKQPMKESMLFDGRPEKTNMGYALAKLVGMEATNFAKEKTGKNYRTFIPCNLYGPKDDFSSNGHVMAALISKICDAKRDNKKTVILWGDGSPRREFLHVYDCAEAIELASKQIDGENYVNIGSGQDLSIWELATKIAQLVGWSGEFVFDTNKPNGMIQKLLDITVLNKLQWAPKINIDNGIKRFAYMYEHETY